MVPRPTTDIVTALAYLFIALTDDNISFIEIPDNLLSFLGLSPMADGTTVSMNAGGIGGSLLAGGLYSAVRTQLASSQALQGGLPEMLLALGGSSGLSAPGVVHPTPGGVGASGMAEQHSVGLKATLAGGLVPDEVRSVIQHTVDAFLAPLSLVILAAWHLLASQDSCFSVPQGCSSATARPGPRRCCARWVSRAS